MNLIRKRDVLIIGVFVFALIVSLGMVSAYSSTSSSFIPPATYKGETVTVTGFHSGAYTNWRWNFIFTATIGKNYDMYFLKEDPANVYAVLRENSVELQRKLVDNNEPSLTQYELSLMMQYADIQWTYTESAPTPPIQTILKISSPTNAHGEIYSETNYNTIISYSDVFGKDYTKASPNLCNATNVVLKLSATTNAHAQTKTQTGYNTNVCYGDLVCTARASCQGDERIVARLSGDTNAHLGTSTGSAYTTLICCYSPFAIGGGGTVPVCGNGVIETGETCDDGDYIGGDGCSATCQVETGWTCTGTPSVCTPTSTGTITEVYWTDNAGGRLRDLDNDGVVDVMRYVGNTVRLVADTTLGAGQAVTFNVFESDYLGDDDIKLFSNILTDSDGKASVSWEITPQNIIDGENENPSKFYFDTIISGNSKRSLFLNVLNEDGPNMPPIAIINPLGNTIYPINEIIQFTHSSVDTEGDIVSAEWDFGDGTTGTGNSVTHAYTSEGEYTITLTVTDEDGAIDSDDVTIYVDNPNTPNTIVIAIIDKPEEGTTLFGKLVQYSGESSFAVENANGAYSCAGGKCPTEVGESGDYLISGSGTVDYSNMFFSWSYGNDNDATDAANGKVTGEKLYLTFGDKTIRLTLSAGSDEGIAINKFTILRSNGCSLDGKTLTELGEDGITYSTSTPWVCSLPGDGNACCPDGQACILTSIEGSNEEVKKCSSEGCSLYYKDADNDLNSIIKCDDFNKLELSESEKENQCEIDYSQCNKVGSDPDNPEYKAALKDGPIENSYCSWTGGKCKFVATHPTGIIGEYTSYTIEQLTDSGCTGEETTHTITFLKTWDDGRTETVESDPIPCGKGVVELPLIGWFGIISVIVFVGVIYFLTKRE